MNMISTISPEHIERANRLAVDRRNSVRGRNSRNGYGLMPFRMKMRNPVYPGGIDVIDQPSYDTVSFAAGAAMAKTVLFQTPIGQSGKTLAQTNMTQPGQLQFPQSLVVTAIKAYISNNTVPADLQNLLTNVSFTLTIGLKPFLQCPLVNLPSGMGGIVTAVGQLGTSGAAQNIPIFTSSNGCPDPRAAFTLSQPISIGAGEGFYVTLNPETAFNFAAAGGATIGAGATIQIWLDGVLTRSVQ